MKPDYQIVEDSPELFGTLTAKGITNRDTSAYERYMEGALARKRRKEKLDETVEEINNIKQEMSEMKEMVRQLLENKSMATRTTEATNTLETFRVNFNALVDDIGNVTVVGQ